MSKFTIEVSRAALNKITKEDIEYSVVDVPNALRDLLLSEVPNMDELSEYDHSRIVALAKEAHQQQLSLEVDIYLGRDSNDNRNYTYQGCIIGGKYPDVTFTQLDKVIK